MFVENEAERQKLKYPKSVFFIISNEFCERFSFYGMRTVLTLYLKDQLKYDKDTATVIYHVFIMFAYFFPLFGAMLADSILGKFRTIFFLSIVYAIGQFLLAMSAAPPIGLPASEFSFIGLLLIAFGTGGIKPCVSAFGGDQFILPQQERYLSIFFSLFYFSINFGSLFSTFLTPTLRAIGCFGQETCYSLAFLIPAILMTVSIVIFVCGKSFYRIVKPTGNVVFLVTKCISHAIYGKATSKKGQKKDHWLDYANDRYDQSLINDIKSTLQVLKLFIPIPIFWALYDQQGSRWTIQATQMDGQIGSYVLQPDSMMVINPLLVLMFIPLFEAFIYPVLAKIGISTPLRKLFFGGVFTALSFIVSAGVQVQLEKTFPVLPSEGLAQVRVFNTLDCPVDFTIDAKRLTIEKMGMYVDQYVEMKSPTRDLVYSADFTQCKNAGYFNATKDSVMNGILQAKEANATSWVITNNGLTDQYLDTVNQPTSGNPSVRALFLANTEKRVTVKLVGSETFTINQNPNSLNNIMLDKLKVGTYDITVDDKAIKKSVSFKSGGVYTLTGYFDSSNKDTVNDVIVTEPFSLHMLWIIPQYVLITMGEVMFSVTGLEFAFTQAPTSMKSLLQASWQLTVALGNLIVVFVAEWSLLNQEKRTCWNTEFWAYGPTASTADPLYLFMTRFKEQYLIRGTSSTCGSFYLEYETYEFILFAGLMIIDMLIFALMTRFYKYAVMSEEESVVEEINMELKNGSVHPSYKESEK